MWAEVHVRDETRRDIRRMRDFFMKSIMIHLHERKISMPYFKFS
jgi:hypothetical protein